MAIVSIGARHCVVGLVLSLASTLPAVAADGGAFAISGRVLMGTTGAALPAELEVQVVQLSSTGEKVAQHSARTGLDGSFAVTGFESRGSRPRDRYLVSTVYREVTYSRVIEDTGGPIAPIELEVFEVTEDPSVVSIESDTTTVLQGKENNMEVFQLSRVRNSSDRAFIGTGPAQPRAVVRISLPEGAFDLAAAEEVNPQGISSTSQGVASASPLLPGETAVSYLYKVKADRNGWGLRRDVFYPTAKAELLIGPGLRLRAAPGFEFKETKKLGGPTYRRYQSGALTPGSSVGADIGYATEGSGGLWFGLAFGASILLAAVLGGSLWMRRRKAPSQALPASVPLREKLIEQIALLDTQFESGAIAEAAYVDQRNQMKQRLAAINLSMAERSS